MRKNMKKFLASAFGALALVFAGGAVATADFTAEAAVVPTLAIRGGNLWIDSNVDILFAVTTTNLDESAKVDLLVWDSYRADGNYTKATADYQYEQLDKEDPNMKSIYESMPEEGRAYRYDQLEIKEIVDSCYACAYTTVNGVDYYSPVFKYSPLKYAFNMRAKIEAGEANDNVLAQQPIVDAILDLGAAMQTWKGYKTDFLANDPNLVSVTIENASFEDGFNNGIFAANMAVEVKANLGYQLEVETGNYSQVGDKIIYTVPAETIVRDNSSFVLIPGSEGLKYGLNEDGLTYFVEMGSCTEEEVIISPVYEGKPVTKIAANSFKNSAITSISIPRGIKEIGANAFAYCSALTEITIPNTVTTVGEQAFANTGLVTVNVSSSVNSIDTGAFIGSNSLTAINVDVANTVYMSYNGDLYSKNGETLYAYASGKADTSFTVPEATTRIGAYAVAGASMLQTVVLHNNIESMGVSAFADCVVLKEVEIPNKIQSIAGSAFANCIALTRVILHEGNLSNVAQHAFSGCSSLTGVYYDGNVFDVRLAPSSGLEDVVKYCYQEKYCDLTYAAEGEYVYHEKLTVVSENCMDGGGMLSMFKSSGKIVISSVDIISMFTVSGAKTLPTLNIYASVDGQKWEVIHKATGAANSTTSITLDVPNYTYKYLMLEATSSAVAVYDCHIGMYSAQA